MFLLISAKLDIGVSYGDTKYIILVYLSSILDLSPALAVNNRSYTNAACTTSNTGVILLF